MATASNTSLSVGEYIRLENAAEYRSEYIDGQMVAMAGGTVNHALISTNLLEELGYALREKDCFVFGSDMRIRTASSGIYTYADASVACGQLELVENTLTNPVLIAEVLSESTEAHDPGRKFAAYRQIEGLRDYLLISQTQALVEHFGKEPDGTWRLRVYSSGEETLAIETLGIALRMAEIYRKVQL